MRRGPSACWQQWCRLISWKQNKRKEKGGVERKKTKVMKKNQLYGQKSQIQRPTNNPLKYEKNQKRKMTGTNVLTPRSKHAIV